MMKTKLQDLSESFWTRSRLASAVVFLAVNIVGFWLLATSPPLAPAMILSPAFGGLFCVWFPEHLSRFTGRAGLTQVTAQTPAGVIYFAGWCLLVLPVPLYLLAT